MSDRRPAKYTDGETAREHLVMVDIAPTYLMFEVEGHTHFWKADRLALQDMVDGAPRLSHHDEGEARLVFTEASAADSLKAAQPELFRKRRDGWRREVRQISTFMAVILTVGGLFYLSLPFIAGAIVSQVPVSYEQKLGRSVLGSISALFPGADMRCNRGDGRGALMKLQYRFTRHRDFDIPIQVYVVPVKAINAIALPGGIIVIFQGLLDQAESAGEVAAVLAHEIGHTQHRHGMQGLIRGNAIKLLVSIIAPGSGDFGSSAATFIVNLAHTREAEREADEYALDLLKENYISADGFRAFFERLQSKREAKGDEEPPALLSSHPSTAERLAFIDDNSAEGSFALRKPDWDRLRTICDTTSGLLSLPRPIRVK